MPLTTRARLALLSLAFPAVLLASPAHAETVACPALDAAVQVAACPAAAERQYTFMGFCGDNARLYGRDVLTCASFENYKEVKNTALWESANGHILHSFPTRRSSDLLPELQRRRRQRARRESGEDERREEEQPDATDLRLPERPPHGDAHQGELHGRGGGLQRWRMPRELRLSAIDRARQP